MASSSTVRRPSRARAKARQQSLPGQVVLVLQGGGALGAYQVGVYQALHEAGGKGFTESRECFRRQFFGQQFDEERGLFGLIHVLGLGSVYCSSIERSTLSGGAQAGRAASCASVVRPRTPCTGLPSIGKPSFSRES